MNPMDVLVISNGTATAAWLALRLGGGFLVRTAVPGPELISAVRDSKPAVAVLDGIDGRPALARLEVALLKDQCPGVRIIALSEASSETDAEVIEQGVFCYLGGCSLQELLRVVQSAARSVAGAAGKTKLRSVP
jgi:hypothetical protein